MKTKFKVVVFCTIFAMLLPMLTVSAASFGKPSLNVDKNTAAITIDGLGDESVWSSAPNLASSIDGYKSSAGWATAQPTDCGKVETLKILWDENYLYCFIQVNDSTISAKSATSYNNDSVEYFVDGLNCKKTNYITNCDGQYRLGRDGMVDGTAINATTFTANSKSVSTDTDYTQELKIAMIEHGVTTLAEAQSVGFDIQVNDAADGARKWQIVWNSQDAGWYDPSSLGTIVMAAVVTPSPTPTPTIAPTTAPTPTPPIVGAVTIKLNKTSATLKVPKTLQLTATVSIPYIADKSVKWTTSNAKIATVSKSGLVTAKEPGVATITATTVTGSKKATCKVTVVQPVTSIKLNKTSLSIMKGKTSKLIATIMPSDASNKKVVWKSSNKSIATVTTAGVVKGIKKGSAYISVTSVDGNKTAKCKVTVK